MFCPGPSSLNRPHPPHSQVHRDFTACRLIRNAFAVRERLGDPRAVPGFRCSFLPGMPSSPTPGRPTSKCSRASMPTWPSPFDHRLGTPKTPAIRSTRASHFVASLVRFRYGLPGCSPPCTDQTGTPQPSGTFTSRLSTDRSPSPPLDITTTATGLLCWRDSHPPEWQLASLHGQRQNPKPKWEFPRLCRGGSKSLTYPGVEAPRSIAATRLTAKRTKGIASMDGLKADAPDRGAVMQLCKRCRPSEEVRLIVTDT